MDSGTDNPQPPSVEWWQTLRRVLDRVVLAAQDAAAADPAFGRDVARLVGGLISAPPAPAQTSGDIPSPAEQTAPPTMPPPVPAQPYVPQPFTLIGPRVVEPAPTYPRQWTAQPFEPERIAVRCRTKAAAARWQIDRRWQLDQGLDVVDQDHALVDRARENGIFLWMVSPSRWRERTETAFATVAGCYEALADAAEVMGLADGLRRQQAEAMKLLAEAQSALRAAVEDYSSTSRDEDQDVTFSWLRRETAQRGVFVQYMQIDHPAQPDNHADLRRRIADVRRRLQEVTTSQRRTDEFVKKVAYHARKLQEQLSVSPDEPITTDDHDLRSITSAVASLAEAGVPASDTRLRESLLPVADHLPADISPSLRAVIEAIDDYRDRLAAEDAESDDADRIEPDSVDLLVCEARRLVEGRGAVMIGGVPSEPHRRRLQEGLGLSSLRWERIEHHESFDGIESAIRRPDVRLVIVMTRWRAHRDGPAARSVCKELNIPLVELPAGYNLRQVAHQIVNQLGGAVVG